MPTDAPTPRAPERHEFKPCDRPAERCETPDGCHVLRCGLPASDPVHGKAREVLGSSGYLMSIPQPADAPASKLWGLSENVMILPTQPAEAGGEARSYGDYVNEGRCPACGEYVPDVTTCCRLATPFLTPQPARLVGGMTYEQWLEAAEGIERGWGEVTATGLRALINAVDWKEK